MYLLLTLAGAAAMRVGKPASKSEGCVAVFLFALHLRSARLQFISCTRSPLPRRFLKQRKPSRPSLPELLSPTPHIHTVSFGLYSHVHARDMHGTNVPTFSLCPWAVVYVVVAIGSSCAVVFTYSSNCKSIDCLENDFNY